MSIARHALQAWQQEDGAREQILDVLAAAGIEVNYIHSTADTRRWGLFLRLPADLALVIGTQREVLLWGSLHSEAQARDLQRALQVMQGNTVRLAQDALILVTADANGVPLLREAAEGLPFAVLAVTLENLRGYRPRGSLQFSDLVRARFFGRDLYDLRTAVTTAADFFGRSELLTQIERTVTQGNEHVAVFGLRKIGKTSFMLRLRESLRNKEAGLLAQVDLQRANAINPSAEYLLWHLGETLWDSNRRVRRFSDLRLIGRYETFSDVPEREAIFEHFDHDLRTINERTGRPIILMLDEIERMFPSSDSSPWEVDFVRFWQLLRGYDQEMPGQLRITISGTNPQCVEQHAIFGADNPIYSYFATTYLGPLSLTETGDLLRSYGQKMGLDWSTSGVSRVYEGTGGHPALLRTFASMTHRRSHPRAQAQAPTLDEIRAVAADFLIQQGPLLAQIVAILEDQYADEFEILNTLAIGRVQEFRQMARAFPEDTAHLIGYGLCDGPEESTRLRAHLLQTYLQRRAEAADPINSNRASDLVGQPVDNLYQIDSLISSTGGYADVYRATALTQSDANSSDQRPSIALKVLRHGQLSVLEREVEVLQKFDHQSNIVKFIGSGRLDGGQVYLAMEYLEGKTLRAYCQAATRPAERTLMTWCLSLLEALVVMHPKESELRRLRASGSDSGDDLQALLETRYGYIHRDIKPENIIIVQNRGPVLIDFNISTRVSAPVATVSATPGYLPFELLGPQWSPRVDLFQLGLTMLQAAAGDTFDGANLDDLVTIMRDSVSPNTASFLERLVDVSTGGYQTAFTARRDAQRARDRVL